MYVIPDPSICVARVRVYASLSVCKLCIGLYNKKYRTRTRLVCIIEHKA